MTVSKSVLNSVVTLRASMTSELLIRFGVGLAGLDSETYLLPKMVVAWMSPLTLAGISLMNFGSTSSSSLASWVPFWLVGNTLLTRPISTPL